MTRPLILVVDLETSGLTPTTGEPVEIGWCGLTSAMDNLIGRPVFWTPDQMPAARLVRPAGLIPPETSAIHHIIAADTASAPDWAAMMRALFPVLPLHVAAFAAHSARFERQWLTPDIVGDVGWICTWKCALRMWPDAPGHSNQTLRYFLAPPGLDRSLADPAHRAGPDAYVTAHLLALMLERESVETLIRWSAEPALLARVPFGDHRGGRWSEVDDGFLAWVLARDFDEDVLFTARTERARRASSPSSQLLPSSSPGLTRGPTTAADLEPAE